VTPPETGLSQLLAQRIASEGPISVAEFMAEALGHPEFGYYMGKDPLGVAGDFTTAPEISQIFGELVGLWCANSWLALGKPTPFTLAELGPGRGTLMADALRALETIPRRRASTWSNVAPFCANASAKPCPVSTWPGTTPSTTCPCCRRSSSPTSFSTRCRSSSSFARTTAGTGVWSP
jgi:hypothetical protein